MVEKEKKKRRKRASALEQSGPVLWEERIAARRAAQRRWKTQRNILLALIAVCVVAALLVRSRLPLLPVFILLCIAYKLRDNANQNRENYIGEDDLRYIREQSVGAHRLDSRPALDDLRRYLTDQGFELWQDPAVLLAAFRFLPADDRCEDNLLLEVVVVNRDTDRAFYRRRKRFIKQFRSRWVGKREMCRTVHLRWGPLPVDEGMNWARVSLVTLDSGWLPWNALYLAYDPEQQTLYYAEKLEEIARRNDLPHWRLHIDWIREFFGLS